MQSLLQIAVSCLLGTKQLSQALMYCLSETKKHTSIKVYLKFEIFNWIKRHLKCHQQNGVYVIPVRWASLSGQVHKGQNYIWIFLLFYSPQHWCYMVVSPIDIVPVVLTVVELQLKNQVEYVFVRDGRPVYLYIDGLAYDCSNSSA